MKNTCTLDFNIVRAIKVKNVTVPSQLPVNNYILTLDLCFLTFSSKTSTTTF